MSHDNCSEAGWPISIRRFGRGEDVYYTAECLVCSFAKSVDVRASASSAQASALDHLRRHVRDKHPQQLPGQGAPDGP